MKNTLQSLQLLQEISDKIDNKTFHHHYHVLFDIANSFKGKISYVEIGCFAGGSACLMIQRPNTDVFSIDLGEPIPPNVVKENVNKLNIHNNQYTYIQGNSNHESTIQSLLNHVKHIDILFIDGDHSYQGVINDFILYEKFVKSGGYIVFDDYNDFNHCPEVKIAVDEIVQKTSDYKIIGALKNIHGARPAELQDSNVFIIRKK
jgi:predicted O-methyltransferase YrrM